ncbi:TolC family protein [Polynucleobacter sp. AP-Capit-er-40B-B4]|uniref:TolC family protein n=1 Tax=Polynucleobacter sp. AP-Capit-er-40B-B4 TaxID=2576927 RepID=UPI001C0C18C2|nr:TolC family protein [Polynucleobacter sp. AP-Capit-er-40B-B4]
MALITAGMSGCSFMPKPLTISEQQALLQEDRVKAQKDVEPVGDLLTFNEAVARGLKYNLDHRSKLLEQAIALGTYDVSKYDMLPKVLASAGYNYRNNYFITNATGAYSGNPSGSAEPFVNSDKQYGQAGLMLSWSLLDFGVSYFNARQNADRIIVASERRRRTMHVLVQDIQAAYLRAAAAQKLKKDIESTIAEANVALKNSNKVESGGLKPPLDALKYQKALLDNIKILETIDLELSTAKVELNQLINLPAKANLKLEDPDSLVVPNAYNHAETEEFEVRAIVANADLKESIYNARIAVEETRKSMLRLFPGLTFNIGPQTSNNTYYINKNWVEGAANVSFNLWNLLSAPATINLAEQNQELAAQKRMMVQMAIISQVHLSKIQLGNSSRLYARSSEIDAVDGRIAKVTAAKYKEGAASQAEKVAADASYIVSKLRKYQALSQLFAASGKMQATTGMEPHFDSLDETTLTEMTAKVKDSFKEWNSGILPAVPVDPPVASATSNIPRTKPTPAGPAVNVADSPATREVNSLVGNMLKAWKTPSGSAAATAADSASLGDVASKAGDLFKAWKPSPSTAPNPKAPAGRESSSSQDAAVIAKNK